MEFSFFNAEEEAFFLLFCCFFDLLTATL